MTAAEYRTFMRTHLLTYSVYSKGCRNGRLTFGATGEFCDTEEGQIAHGKKIVRAARMLDDPNIHPAAAMNSLFEQLGDPTDEQMRAAADFLRKHGALVEIKK